MNRLENEPKVLLRVALRLVKSPEMRRAIGYGQTHPEIFKQQLQELDAVINLINKSSLKDIPEDMTNTRKLKEMMEQNGKSLPTPWNSYALYFSEFQKLYRKMLREGNQLLGTYFHFHEHAKDDGLRLAAGVIDGYSLFLCHYFDQDYKSFQGVTANAICEVLAEQAPKREGSSMLFQTAKELKWYAPGYGLAPEFLARHGFPLVI